MCLLVWLVEYDVWMMIVMDVMNFGGVLMDLMYMVYLNYVYVLGGCFE